MLIATGRIFQTRFDWRATPQWYCFTAIYILGTGLYEEKRMRKKPQQKTVCCSWAGNPEYTPATRDFHLSSHQPFSSS